MQKLPITDNESILFTKIVRKINFFASMNMGLLEKILGHIAYYSFDKGEKICRQGDPGDSFYVVAEGKLGVSVKSGFFSFSRKVAELGPGSCFGEMALLSRAPRTATVACEEPAKLFVLLADHFDAAMAQNPAFAEEIRKLAADRKFDLDHK
ncbi:MAG: hypothetical protein CVU79_07440 [Elusimicrobia bacterium HGW-Elusimicrobia-3]|nr:MAG: hypothetical protein CVU79_07440 [Elusimicrobia bacterium HGW-Elusimicrobia-3]